MTKLKIESNIEVLETKIELMEGNLDNIADSLEHECKPTLKPSKFLPSTKPACLKHKNNKQNEDKLLAVVKMSKWDIPPSDGPL